MRADPASFRDPHSRVFAREGHVFRALSEEGLASWNALVATDLFRRFLATGSLVETELLDGGAAFEDARRSGFAALLRHERVPFVSYPYEWPFGMLRDAALLQLDLLAAALDEGLTLKDASPYNVQWRGSHPLFVDVGSFERYRDGEPWIGYRQFCMLFLYPLLLQAYKGVSFQPWLRGAIDGIPPSEMRRLLSLRDLLRRGVLSHVVLHSRLAERYDESGRNVTGELRRAGFRVELIKANVRRLAKLVGKLRWDPSPSGWTQYGAAHPYSERDEARKAEFVREVAASSGWDLAWDLGCNDGRHSRIVAEHARYVVAIDGDRGVVEELYRALRNEGDTSILPLTVDLADPSPNLGWRAAERSELSQRRGPDLVLCLALVHHLAISRSVPLGEIVEWLRGLGAALVVEFPAEDDPNVRRLLARRPPGTHHEYTLHAFERALSEAFEIERREVLGSGTRILYFARPAWTSP